MKSRKKQTGIAITGYVATLTETLVFFEEDVYGRYNTLPVRPEILSLVSVPVRARFRCNFPTVPTNPNYRFLSHSYNDNRP